MASHFSVEYAVMPPRMLVATNSQDREFVKLSGDLLLETRRVGVRSERCKPGLRKRPSKIITCGNCFKPLIEPLSRLGRLDKLRS